MLLQDVTIKKVPSAATAVTVTIAPLFQNITVNGSFCGTDGSQTISLTKQSDGRTWQNAQPLPSHQGEGPGVGSVFLLPPSSSASDNTDNNSGDDNNDTPDTSLTLNHGGANCLAVADD